MPPPHRPRPPGWVESLTLLFRRAPVHLPPDRACRYLTYTSFVGIKGEDLRSKQNKFDDEPGENRPGSVPNGPVPSTWVNYAWTNWQGAAGLGRAASSYQNPNPNMEETTRQLADCGHRWARCFPSHLKNHVGTGPTCHSTVWWPPGRPLSSSYKAHNASGNKAPLWLFNMVGSCLQWEVHARCFEPILKLYQGQRPQAKVLRPFWC